MQLTIMTPSEIIADPGDFLLLLFKEKEPDDVIKNQIFTLS
jgi:hypothetical protein